MGRDTAERLNATRELNDIRNLIDEIERFGNAPLFDEKRAREIIQEVNRNHFENVVLYNLATYQPKENSSNIGSGVSIHRNTEPTSRGFTMETFLFESKIIWKVSRGNYTRVEKQYQISPLLKYRRYIEWPRKK